MGFFAVWRAMPRVWPVVGPRRQLQAEDGDPPALLHPHQFKGTHQSRTWSQVLIVPFCVTVNLALGGEKKKSGFFSTPSCQNARRRLFLTFSATVKE